MRENQIKYQLRIEDSTPTLALFASLIIRTFQLEQCFSLTTNQLKTMFRLFFQRSERGHYRGIPIPYPPPIGVSSGGKKIPVGLQCVLDYRDK